jgi:hypothetical protein
MDCKTARLLLDFARPLCPEMEPADAEALQSHLAECPECGPFAVQERRLDDHLGRAMRDVSLPEDLKQRLLNRLSKERDDWWKRCAGRWGLRYALPAAAVLLALAGAWYLWPLPKLDVQQIQIDLSVKAGASEDTVRQYFQNRHFAMGVPGQFDFTKLREYHVEEFEGRRVPALVFSWREEGGAGFDKSTQFAKVLVLNNHQFDLTDLRERRSADSGVPKVAIVDLGDPDVVFAVIYDANDFRKILLGIPVG